MAKLGLKDLKSKKIFSSKVINTLRALEPNPRCELYYETPFQLLVSVVLSAQTTDKAVNKCMKPLYEKCFTPESVLKDGQVKLLSQIRSIGLAPTKSKNIIKLAEMIQNEFQGQIPDVREDLISLPGVGQKTASVVLGEIFNHPTLAVDTHVFRVTKRLGLHCENSAEKAESRLMDIVEKKFLPKAHHWFILLGRYTCKARSPECHLCPLAEFCPRYI